MSTFIIAKESNIAGSTLKELRLRRKGINIAFIKRGEIMVKIPTKNERFWR
jgi:CPA2 family monovalent cation:H+ antiporter-2